MVDIRRANSSDHDGLVDLWIETGLGRLGEAEWDVLVAHPAAAILVAEDGEDMVGAAVASFDGWRAYIYHVAVAESARHHGVARALMDEAAEHLFGEGASAIYVMVNEENTGGLALAAAGGYMPEGEIVLVRQRTEG